MLGKQWVNFFWESLVELENLSNTHSDGEWTSFMMKVIRVMEKKTNCRVIGRDSENPADSGEYLNIDAMFLDKTAYSGNWAIGDWDPYVLPSVVVEHENDYGFKKIMYCLWKIYCIRAKLRVLICYQSDEDKILLLQKNLTEAIKHGRLDDRNELLVIVGNGAEERSIWKRYFNIFEWEEGSLVRVSAS